MQRDLTPEQRERLTTVLTDLRAIGVLTGPDGSEMPCASGGFLEALAPVVAQLLADERERVLSEIEALNPVAKSVVALYVAVARVERGRA